MKKRGIMIEHEDGRKGISYYSDQKGLTTRKTLVTWLDSDGKVHGKSLVDPVKLKIIGYTD